MNHHYKKLIISFLFSFVMLTVGCFTFNQISKQNVAQLYSDAELVFHPDYLLYHFSNDSSTLYFKINTNELLYAREGFMTNFTSKFIIKYELLADYEAKQVIDSARINYVDTVITIKKKQITDSIKIKVPYGRNYVLRLTATDINRTKEYVSYLNVNKQNSRANQNFIIRDGNNQLVFENYIDPKQAFRIIYRKDTLSHLFIKYYKNKFPIASPPFNYSSGKTVTIYPDSIYTLPVNKKSTGLIYLNKEGVYRVMADTSQKESLTLYRFYEDFPEITVPEQMIYSVRYLTTRQEFDDMIIRANKKEAIDNFWIELAGNSDRARQLIKSYYGRVRLANIFFSSYYEGWKTDRGMIYIIYGPPSTVFKSTTTENWIYGDASSLKSINFMFYKVDNPFTENDYLLSRSDLFRDSWYYAVSNWRR